MIRKDREITDFEELMQVVSRCDYCTLGLNGDDGVPYLLPLNFGFKPHDGRLTLFFHSALVGKKHELIARDGHAAFSMNCGHELIHNEARGYCTMNYESVIGRGKITYITDEKERLEALTLLTDRFHNGHFAFNLAAMPRTAVYKLEVETMTGKKKASKP